MAAYDSYSGTARCPNCGDWHWESGQTRFFDPSFLALFSRSFKPGKPNPLDFDPAELFAARLWEDQWVRIGEPEDPAVVRLLIDFDGMSRCPCGIPLAAVLRFRLTADGEGGGTATLEEVTLHDAREDGLGAEIDFAEVHDVVRWRGSHEARDADTAALSQAPPAARAARLRDALRDWFDREELDAYAARIRWTPVAGPVRCEACGRVRERVVHTSFTDGNDAATPFLGDGWKPGVLRIGTRVDGGFGWLDEDGDRGFYVRLRHPLSPSGFTVTDGTWRWGCACGAGRAAVILRFARDAGGVTLASATLRVLRARGDAEDIDFAHSRHGSRDFAPHTGFFWRPASRDEALSILLGVPAEPGDDGA